MARMISGTFQAQSGLERAFLRADAGYGENRGCAWSETVMCIIDGIHAHQLSKSCASSRQIMRINRNNDADDLIIHWWRNYRR